jgi:hypothetical protein
MFPPNSLLRFVDETPSQRSNLIRRKPGSLDYLLNWYAEFLEITGDFLPAFLPAFPSRLNHLTLGVYLVFVLAH